MISAVCDGGPPGWIKERARRLALDENLDPDCYLEIEPFRDQAALLFLVTTDSDEWKDWGWDVSYERNVDMMLMCPAATAIADVAKEEGYTVETFSAEDIPGWQDVYSIGGLARCIHKARLVKENGIVFFDPDFVTWLPYTGENTHKRELDGNDIYGDTSNFDVRKANFINLVVNYLVIMLRVRDVHVVVMNPARSLFFQA
eukprot:2130402-Pyramimonas_sp.AAC.1